MNILTERLPKAIRVNGTVYPINSDFRDCLRIILAFEDNDLTWLEKQAVLLENLYAEQPPDDDIQEAIRQGVKFLDGGDTEDSEEDKAKPMSERRLYSFSKDGRFIFTAFQQTHGIDLQNTEYLHWWHFLTLFLDLGSETLFCSLVGLRKRVNTGKATKEERAVAREMGDVFTVPQLDTRPIEQKEREREFVNQVKEARRNKHRNKKDKANG